MLLEPYDATSILYGSEGKETQQCVSFTRQLEYAIHFFKECRLKEIPEDLRDYINYEKFERDLFVERCFSIDLDGNKHIFMSH